ncbi:hypothetical protein Thiowin_02764 [Thiorhodovibrio winogradskyi]|uniref:Uncharacterized protein n=1 Tax=Thiorhodovibrio winogradskyi TaxID=77007 RepID=A0ABZ0SDQ8_9GAMM|nr:hypothetical protein [Thiorhodovibrio winogradskyi]
MQYWPDCSIQWVAVSGIASDSNPKAAPVASSNPAIAATPEQGGRPTPTRHPNQDGSAWETDESLPQLVLTKNGMRLCELSLVCPSLRAERLVSHQIHRLGSETRLKWLYHLEPAPDSLLMAQILVTLHPLGYLDATLTLHNPRAALHPGGRWDLGDPHSVVIQGIGWDLRAPAATTPVLELDGTEYGLQAGDTLTQASSGGEHWQSPVHMTADKRVDLPFKGYRWHHKGRVIAGDRASPIVRLESEEQSLCLSWCNFWQQFSNQIICQQAGHGQPEDSAWRIAWRWHRDDERIDLQPGEKLSKTFRLMVGDSPAAPQEAPPRFDLRHLIDAKVVPFLTQPTEPSAIEALTDVSLDDQQGFFAKREALDAYGWRNFGDLFADHESALSDQQGIFVSHYNNQYDPISGFLYRYLNTGDIRWWELARDLVDHVINIDIYDTLEDRPEYNGGLFWHTDHYLPAMTSSHRSFSRNHTQGIYQGHAGGGGPGGQHCYTTGLALHHLLTGCEQSKAAVLQLTDWITRYYDGTDSVLELAWALINRRVPGLKNPFTGQYPLDRGTGNFINAKLDAYWVTGNPAYLDDAGRIIRHSIHPRDDIARGNLSNVEDAWFYTVLLQGVIRYLWFKEQRDQPDDHWGYAVHSLLHYADWMLAHEYLYLDKPEILEFPNQTWTAQDLRKACILYAAARYHPTNRNAMRETAHAFETEIQRRLANHQETALTRVQAILLQNLPMLTHYRQSPAWLEPLPERPSGRSPFDNNPMTAKTILQGFLSRLRRVDWRKEQRWLAPRLPVRNLTTKALFKKARFNA